MHRLTVLLIALVFCPVVSGQAPPQMRTRILTHMTNTEIEQYLKRNDVIFIPVGTVEPHAELPIDSEYVGPLAYAIKLAEEGDGLVLPGLAYFFPDATVVGRGAVHVTPSQGTAYLMTIARSLLRQGFRRQVYITGHAPSWQTVSPLVRQFYDETHVPILYLESAMFHRPSSNTKPPDFADFAKMTYGAYAIAGRLEDIPVNLSEPVPEHPADPGINNLFPVGPQSGAIGFYMSHYTDHIGPAKAVTAEQRVQWGKEGAAMIDESVKTIDIKRILQALRDHDKFTQEHIIPQYSWMFSNQSGGEKSNDIHQH
jgi:creatinine amidohydrolase